jgi:TRAP transporter 4TM/12TM fusion protein
MHTDELTRLRQPKGAMSYAISILLIALPIWGLAYFFDVHIYLGIRFTLPQYIGGFLALLLGLTFLLFPAKKAAPRNLLPWYDILLALLGFAVGVYLVLYHPDIEGRHYIVTPFEVFLGTTAILLILEAARRTTGWVLPIMGCIFLFYAFYANIFPGILQGKGHSFDRVVPYLYLTESGILGVALHMASTIVVAYVLFGETLLASGGGKLVSDLCLALVGRFRGGPAKVAVLASAFFGTMSGSPGANVVVTGTFTIPMMKRVGYKPHFAAAVEAVSSTGGLIAPPVMGVAAFLMAEFLGTSYTNVVIAAVLPAVLYFIGVFAQVDFEAAKQGLRGLPSKDSPPLRHTLKISWQLLFPLAVLIYFLLIARITPTTAGLYGIVATILASLWRRESRLGPRKLLFVLERTAESMLNIGVITAFVGIIIGCTYLTGLGLNLSVVLTSVAGGNVAVLLVLAAGTSILLGMGMPSVACYALLATLIGPALKELGVDLFGAHLFLLYFGAMSFITPPVAPAVIIAAGMAKSSYLRVGWQACRLGIVAYLAPFIFILNPVLLMRGGVVEIAFSFLTAAVGVVLLAAALEGYLFKRVNWLERVAFLIGGIALFIPGWKTDMIGALPIAYVCFRERQALLTVPARFAHWRSLGE